MTTKASNGSARKLSTRFPIPFRRLAQKRVRDVRTQKDRRRMTKEDAIYGVFAEEEEETRPKRPRDRRPHATRGAVSFVSSGRVQEGEVARDTVEITLPRSAPAEPTPAETTPESDATSLPTSFGQKCAERVTVGVCEREACVRQDPRRGTEKTEGGEGEGRDTASMEGSGTDRLRILRAAFSRHCQQTHAEDGIQARRRTGSAQARSSRAFSPIVLRSCAMRQAWWTHWCRKCVQRAWGWGMVTSRSRDRNLTTLPTQNRRSLPREMEP